MIGLEEDTADYQAVIVKLRSHANYAIILPSKFKPSLVEQYAVEQQHHIDSMVTNKRPGPAGGVYQFGTKCPSFSSVGE